MHPYTQALFSAALPVEPATVREEIVLSASCRAPSTRRRAAVSTRAAGT